MAAEEHQEERAGANLSLWEASVAEDRLNPLTENTSADVCIVGAGIAGLSIAYELSRLGQKVIVLDDGLIGRGMTGRTTAHLVNALDDRYNNLVVSANSVVVATNSPINDRYVIHTKQAPYMTYVIGLRVRRGVVARTLLWDTAERAGMERGIGPVPYHYVRTAPGAVDDEEILIVGGEDHKSGQANDFEARFDRLEDWARARWPKAEEIVFRWSGQVMEPVDNLGYIGRNPSDERNV